MEGTGDGAARIEEDFEADIAALGAVEDGAGGCGDGDGGGPRWRGSAGEVGGVSRTHSFAPVERQNNRKATRVAVMEVG